MSYSDEMTMAEANDFEARARRPEGETARANRKIRENGTADEQDRWAAWGYPWPFVRPVYERMRSLEEALARAAYALEVRTPRCASCGALSEGVHDAECPAVRLLQDAQASLEEREAGGQPTPRAALLPEEAGDG